MAALGSSVLKFSCSTQRLRPSTLLSKARLFPTGGHGGLPRQSPQTPSILPAGPVGFGATGGRPSLVEMRRAPGPGDGTHCWMGWQCYRMSIRFSNCWSPSE